MLNIKKNSYAARFNFFVENTVIASRYTSPELQPSEILEILDMNFNISEINNWYKTEAGKINQDLVVDSINNIILDRYDRSILYIGPNDITKKIMERDKSFNSFFVSTSKFSDIKAEIENLPLWISKWLREKFLSMAKKFENSEKIFIDRSESNFKHCQLQNNDQRVSHLNLANFGSNDSSSSEAAKNRRDIPAVDFGSSKSISHMQNHTLLLVTAQIY